MDFNFPEELQILKSTVGRFVERELIPLERQYRPEGEEMPEHCSSLCITSLCIKSQSSRAVDARCAAGIRWWPVGALFFGLQ